MNLNFLLFEHAQTAESSICVKRVPKIHIFNILNLIFTVLLKIILNFRGRSKIYNSKFSIMFNCSFFLLNCYFSAREWFDSLTTREWYDRPSHNQSDFISALSNNEFCFEHNQNKPIKISTFNPPQADGGICYAFGSNARACCC
jgi:hypothetical protein